jgi:pyruvate dehydrogenase E2 component (dihydrolipoamide acetyltransferase)
LLDGEGHVPIEVTMPKLSPTMESGVIAQWLVKVGDTIKEGDILADIETDKATMQMKSYEDGVIVHIDHPAGDEVALGQRVMVMAKKGEDAKQVVAGLGLGGAQAAPASRSAATEDKPAAPLSGSAGATSSVNNGQPEVSVPPAEGHGGRLKASPLARKMAESSQIELGRIQGTGPGGRIIRRDIEAHLSGASVPLAAPASGVAQTAPPPLIAPAQPAAPRPAAPPLPAASKPTIAPPITGATPPASQRIAHSRMRKTIAARMLQAKQTAPEIHVTVDVRVDKMLAVREELNRQLAAENIKLSPGDFVTKAVAIALRRHPGLNASYEEDAIVRHGEINIGIAVALEEGLIVPVLHRADLLGLAEIRRQSAALAVAARSNQLTSEHLAGSTFTISNLGMFGTSQFDAILNLPEVGILAVAAAERRPVVEGDKLVPGTILSLTLTADHRAVDGAMAADFMRTVKRLLEEPATMLL